MGLVHRKRLKLVLALLTQQNTVLCVSKSYKIKYYSFDCFMHYCIIKYAWEDIHIVPHTSNHDSKWGKYQMIKQDPI